MCLHFLNTNIINSDNKKQLLIRLKFQKNLINKYVDECVSFKSNEKITKEVYKNYLNDLLLVSGRVNFNDFIDINIFFAAYTNNLKIVSNDKKTNKLLTMFNIIN